MRSPLVRLAPTTTWTFVHKEKCLKTLWDELLVQFQDLQYLCSSQSLWFAKRDIEVTRDLTPTETHTNRQRALRTTKNQYNSLYTALTKKIQRDAWEVKKVSFIEGTRSLNEDHLKANLKLFVSFRTEVGERIFDECANIFD